MDAGQRQESFRHEEPPNAPPSSPVDLADAYALVRDAEQQWREQLRIPALEGLFQQTAGLRLTRSLLLLLLEELSIDDEFDEIVGNPDDLPATRFPQAIAMAIALRHSWRGDDLESVVEALAASGPPGSRRSKPR